MSGLEQVNQKDDTKVCYNCGETGHVARGCLNERAAGVARQAIVDSRARHRRCYNCGKIGHISQACPIPQQGNKACYSCGKEGHIARECPESKKNAE